MQRRRHFTLQRGHVLITALVLAIIIAFASLHSQQISLFFRQFAPSCTIGFDGPTITVKGWHADDDCTAMLFGPDNFTGIDWGKMMGSRVSEATGQEDCEYDIAGRHVTVRDPGSGANGQGLCMLLVTHMAGG